MNEWPNAYTIIIKEEYEILKAKAEKWRRVINTLEVCQDCPLRYRCVDGCVVEELVDALEGKEVK